MINNALFITLITGLCIEMVILLDEIQILKDHSSRLERELLQMDQSIHEKSVKNDSFNTYLIGGVSIIIVLALGLYFSGPDSSSISNIINDLGDQTLELFQKQLGNNTNKFMSVHRNQEEIIRRISRMDERVGDMLLNLSNQLHEFCSKKSGESVLGKLPGMPNWR